MLSLVSYDARDPSWNTLAVGRSIQNPMGLLGAYFSDTLVTLWGYGSYVLPLALFGLAATSFSLKSHWMDGKIGWHRPVCYLLIMNSAAIMMHLYFGEVNISGREADAGGLMGWWLGQSSHRLLGNSGAYLLNSLLILLSLILVTESSILGALQRAQRLTVLFFSRLKQSFVSWVLVNKARLSQKLSQQFQTLFKDKKTRGIRDMRRQNDYDDEELSNASTSFVASRPTPMKGVMTHTVMNSIEEGEPKIRPRADLKEESRKESKRDQLELVPKQATAYRLPQLSFLDSENQDIPKIDEEALKMNSKLLEKKLMDYGVEGRITEIHPGPVITMYEFEPAAGVKVNKIVNLEDDLSLTMGGKSVRIIAPLPGKPAVGIEIPNVHRETVWLKEVIGHKKFQQAESKLTLAFGKDTEGIPFVADLAKMPHLLVAGATGSGKSVQVNSMILSLLYKATPEDVRLILVDPKMLELSMYQGIPHLLLPVVTNPKKAAMALRWAVGEMERRYEMLSHKACRNIAGYNKLVTAEEHLPHIVIMIDELADLMMTAAKDVETYVARLAQMARAAGIHLILATQRPSVDVLTGLIKANFPARVAFKVSSKHDSRTIIDTIGSEHLLGNGDMLFMSGGATSMLRVHGAYVSETEIARVVEHWKNQGTPQFLDESVLKPPEEEDAVNGKSDEDYYADDLYDQAVSIVTETKQASISMVQRRLRIGYNRAARLIERMEKEGVVGPADGARPREVYASPFE